jgi:hypothetical protein
MSSNTLLKDLNKKSGVYFISQDPIPTNEEDMILVKIGIGIYKPEGSDISKRIQSYLLYWPRGFYIFGIVLTTPKAARDLEKKIHAFLRSKNRKMDQDIYKHSHIEEWFYLTRKEIYKLIEHDEDGEFYKFDAPHFLVENPTAGKQRKVKLLTPQEEFEFYRQNAGRSPIRTADTGMRRKTVSRLYIDYSNPDAAAAAATSPRSSVDDEDYHENDENYYDENDGSFQTPKLQSKRQREIKHRKTFMGYDQSKPAAAAAAVDGDVIFLEPIIDEIDILELHAPIKKSSRRSPIYDVANPNQAKTRSRRQTLRRLSQDLANSQSTPLTGLAKKKSARRDSDRRDSARRKSARRDSDRRDSARRDSARRDSARRDSARRKSERTDSDRSDSARRDSARRKSERTDSDRSDSARRDSARRDSARRDSDRSDSDRSDSDRRKSARRKSDRRKSDRRDSAKRKSDRRDSAKRKSDRRDSAKRKSARRKE